MCSYLDDFFQIYSIIHSNADQLKIFLATINFEEHPVRVIVMHTLKYKDALESKEELIEEEKAQLMRDDIPFFFKFINSKYMYFYDESFEKVVVKKQNERTFKKFNQLANSFDVLLDQQRLETLFANSNLYFAKLFYKEKKWNNFSQEQFSLTVLEDVITFDFRQKKYMAKI